jgi:glycosyltransferase involved in cell wall biosynthesis
MRILFISRGWPSEQLPQWGNFERDQAIMLSDRGHQVISLYLDVYPEHHYKKLGITREQKDGVVVYCLYAGFRWVKIVKRISFTLYSRMFGALFYYLVKNVLRKEGKPDLVYGHYLWFCRRALSIKRKYGVPAVGIEHWSEMGYSNIKEEYKQLAADTYPYLDRQLVVSAALKENILKNIGIDTTVVYDTYGKEFYYKEQVVKDDTVRFVLTGTLLPIKRFDLVIQALGESVSLPKNLQFTIIGDGPEKEKLLGMVEEYHLSDIMHLVGSQTRTYIANALQEADVYILASHLETFGVAPVEALACGVPVIATDCGGSRSYMNDFNGLLIRIDDVKAMSEAISYMAEHYLEYDRKRIAEDCRQRFSSEVIAKQLESIFEDVMANTK